ncbi:MAG: hypothetical protein FJ297_17260 [Planctomycetes bacterium]|nr:hypothetical protein [Planctomycetota bacterium]
MMTATSTASGNKVLDREFFEIRHTILALAASLDRLERAGGGSDDDRRRRLLREGLDVLGSDAPNKAERVQLAFSREYDPAWRSKFGL